MLNLQKTFSDFVKNMQIVPVFTSLVFKSLNFAQILENFAQMCVCPSAAFRSSGIRLIPLSMESLGTGQAASP